MNKNWCTNWILYYRQIFLLHDLYLKYSSKLIKFLHEEQDKPLDHHSRVYISSTLTFRTISIQIKLSFFSPPWKKQYNIKKKKKKKRDTTFRNKSSLKTKSFEDESGKSIACHVDRYLQVGRTLSLRLQEVSTFPPDKTKDRVDRRQTMTIYGNSVLTLRGIAMHFYPAPDR